MRERKFSMCSSTTPGCKDRNFSILGEVHSGVGGVVQNDKTLSMSRTGGMSSTRANICVYNASSSENGKSSLGGGWRPRMMSKRWVGLCRLEVT